MAGTAFKFLVMISGCTHLSNNHHRILRKQDLLVSGAYIEHLGPHRNVTGMEGKRERERGRKRRRAKEGEHEHKHRPILLSLLGLSCGEQCLRVCKCTLHWRVKEVQISS